MSASPQRREPIVDSVVAALVPLTSPLDPGSPQALERREVTAEVEKQIQRVLWRSERRARQFPAHVRHSASFVNGRRRKIAYEISRAILSLGGGELLADAIAERAARRFPADGIVWPDRTEHGELPDRPRARGTSPRQRGVNPRAAGTSPRQRRAAADLSLASPSPAAIVILDETPAPAPSTSDAREPSPEFAEMFETQTRELMRELAAGNNVTAHMTPVQRTKFYERVKAIRDKDASLLQ